MDDWKAGDVAECIDAKPLPCVPSIFYDGLAKGGIYRVSSVEAAPDGRLNLFLDEMPNRGFLVDRFRKIGAPETEISRLIAACRPMPTPVLVPAHCETHHGS